MTAETQWMLMRLELCALRLLFECIICTNKGQPIISFSPVLIVSPLCLCLKLQEAAGQSVVMETHNK